MQRVCMRTSVATTMATAIALTNSVASATPSARLVYSRAAGAESCPDEEALRRAVAARVGYDPLFAWAKKTIIARMAPATSRGFVASVTLVDEQGHEHGARSVHTDRACDELLDVAALAIAIAIDPQSLAPHPSASQSQQELPPAPAPSPPSPPPDEPSPDLTSPPDRGTSPSPLLSGGVGTVLSAGVAPRPAAGLALGATVRWGRVSVGIEGRIDAPASAMASGGGSVSSWLVAAAVVPCAYAGPVLFCALGQVGSMQTTGGGVSDGRSPSVLWLAAGGRFAVEMPLEGRSVLRVRSDIVGNYRPPALYLHSVSVWQAPEISSSLGADIVIHFL
jgi:hypothetical protein